jgi:large repetitive protein
MFDVVRHRFFFILVILALAAPGFADNVTVSGTVNFSALDGSSLDHDGTANGTFTVNDGDLTVLGSINCNDDTTSNACNMNFAVSGNMTVAAGGALYAENRKGNGLGGSITATVGGNVVVGGTISTGNLSVGSAGDITITAGGSAQLQAGSVISGSSKGSPAGDISIQSGGALTAAGLVAAGPSSAVLSTKYTGAVLTGGSSNSAGGAITLRSTSHTEPAVTVASTAVIVSQGENAGAETVVLEGCGVNVNGLVASVATSGAGAKVIVRSGTTASVDGRDLGAGGTRLGMLRADSINQGAGTYSANIFARNSITVQGPASGSLYAINSSGGKTSKDPSGTVNLIATAGGVTASGNAFAANGSNSGDQGGTINVSARDNIVLLTANINASGDFATSDSSRAGGHINVRSYSGSVSWQNGTGDVRPTGSASGVPAAQQGTIDITYCTTVSTAGSSFPTNGAPVGTFPTLTQTCSPAAPSLPSGESHPDCNDPPISVNDAYSVDEGATLTVAAPGVLGNDVDPDGDPMTAILVTGPTHATSFNLNANGSFSYTHDSSETTTDSFTYKANDGTSDGNVATVIITINPVNDPPVAVNDNYTVAEGGTLNVAAPGVKANDVDPDGPVGIVTLVSGPAHAASFTLNPNGSFTYVHNGGETSSDSFTYQLSDGQYTSNATVNIAITAVNDAPVAVNDSYGVNEGGTLTVAAPGVKTNDTDPDGPSSTAILVSGPANASSFALNADGSFTYVHNGSETTSDSFTYKVNDGVVDSNIATVTIAITGVNDAPVAVNDGGYTVAEGGTLNGSTVLANDTDAENNTLTAVLVSGPAHAASFVLNADGTFVYVHNGSETTSDSFTYKASDGAAQSNTATVSITITAVNDAPVANDDAGSVAEGGTLNGTSVLANDTDAENDALTAVLVSGPAHATSFTLNADGTYIYVHNGGESTSDSFTYKASDGSLQSNTATVTITITAVNDAPVASPDFYSMSEGGTLSPAAPGVLGNDTDPDNPTLNAVLVSGPAHASSFTLNANGSFNYVHNGSETTSDSFTYKANDGSLDSNTVTVSISISAVNDAPVAVNDGYGVNEGATLTVSAPGVLGNDTDAENNALTAVLVSGPAHAASFSLNADGSFAYVHNGSETTTDSFTYRANDGTANSNIATVTITIAPVNDAPVANNDSYNVGFHQTITVPPPGVLGNDTDVDTPPASLSATLVSGPSQGNLTFNADGSFSYQHTGATLGTDSFTYQVSDGAATSNTATVTITIANQAPTAVNDNYATVGNTELRVGLAASLNPAVSQSGSVIGNDSDSDGGPAPLTVSAFDATSFNGGTVAMNPNGSFSYLPPTGYTGSDTFNYTITDGIATATATVTVVISNRVWYVSATAVGTQTGRSSEPFATLAQAQTASAINDFIHVRPGTYASGITLKDGQKLVGTGVALVVNSFTLAPASIAPVLQGTIVLANGNTVTGVNVAVSSATNGIDATNVTGGTIAVVNVTGGYEALTVTNASGTFALTDVSLAPSGDGIFIVGGSPTINAANLDIVTTTGTGIGGDSGTLNITAGSDGSTIATGTGAIVSLSNMTLGVSLRSASNTGGMTGLVLTGTTGSFTVTGDGSNAANGSGGSIAGSTLIPVQILDAAGTVTLRSMNVSLAATANSGVYVDNNAGGTLAVNLTGFSITGANSSSQVRALVQVEGDTAANVTTNVQGSFFNNSFTYGLFTAANGNSAMNVTVNQSGFGTNVVTTGATNQPGTAITLPNAIPMAITNGGSAQVGYTVTNNTFWGTSAAAGALYAVTISSSATGSGSALQGTFNGNKIGQTGVAGSGCNGNCSGLGLLPGKNGTFSATVTNNDIRRVGSRGIDYANTIAGSTGSVVIKVKGNTLAEPEATGSFRRAISVTTGNSGGASTNVCAEIGGATVAEQNVVSGAWQAGQFIRVTTLNTTGVLTLPGLTPTTGATAAQVNTFLAGRNAGVTGAVNTTIGGAINGGAPCP